MSDPDRPAPAATSPAAPPPATSGRGTAAMLLWAGGDALGIVLILVAFFALDDGRPRELYGLFSNQLQVIVAAVGVAVMVFTFVMLVRGLLRAIR